MMKCSFAPNGNVNAASAFENSAKMREKGPNMNAVSISAQSREGRENPGPRCRMTRSQVPRERPNSTVSTSNVTSRSHQRRWSVDFCKCQAPPVIMVRKNKKEPEPPQRSASLLRLQTSSYASSKRYSCPPIGNFMSTSSSCSSTSSCCSPTSVPTSVIIGPDPLGWKIQPKSRSSSSQARTKRLSLQIPLPAVPTPSSPDPEPSSQPKPALRPKPSRRHHSESSAFLKSLGKTPPVVTLEQLHAVHLRALSLSDESDDVFGEPTQAPTQGRPKIPPPVPEKTATARKIAQLIASSRKRCRPVTTNGNNITARKSTPTLWHHDMDHNICATKMAELHLVDVCNRNR
ncbi:uncharacterized protein LOC105923731 [Fundulus heteroclitus]|uniref:uncharacterized protein LOC105923731 n=1 Tax=Fundulus heteroclitus TaxID=8078 RepID=UPI00165C71CC|nr:uncharacterized protein LOC105923731 [Fundulus heteroclitus]XP_035998387.1 uncharacterized protein LOC105923731 [Fundulus heteroclitus]